LEQWLSDSLWYLALSPGFDTVEVAVSKRDKTYLLLGKPRMELDVSLGTSC